MQIGYNWDFLQRNQNSCQGPKECIHSNLQDVGFKDVKDPYHVGTVTDSNLEMAGLLFLWLDIIEVMCGNLREKRAALFSDNSQMVGWDQRLATGRSLVLAYLIQALWGSIEWSIFHLFIILFVIMIKSSDFIFSHWMEVILEHKNPGWRNVPSTISRPRSPHTLRGGICKEWGQGNLILARSGPAQNCGGLADF